MATEDQIEDLQRVIGTTELTNEELGEIIDENNGDLTKASRVVWEGKAASYVEMVDTSESGSSRSMGQMFDNALKLAEYFGKQPAPGSDVGRTTTRKIVRE